MQRRVVRVGVDILRKLLSDIFSALGCDETNTNCIVEGLIEADLRGHSIQGTDHIYSIVRDLKEGRLNGRARPRIARETIATAQIDGDGGAGYVGAQFAVDIAIEKAKNAGVAAVGLVRAGDIFMVGAYVERLARAGFAGIAFTNTAPARVHPAGGIDPVLGTNPVAFAFPIADADPIMIDFATSTSAVGHIRIASYSGDPIPAGVAIDRDGVATTNAKQALMGALTPLAGHKGFGLALAGALLSGPLVGAVVGSPLQAQMAASGQIPKRGHLIIAIDPQAYGDADTYCAQARKYVEEIKGSRKATDTREILIPGERSMRRRRESLANGIEMLADIWANTVKIAGELGIKTPAPN